jgi:hypothetical protein
MAILFTYFSSNITHHVLPQLLVAHFHPDDRRRWLIKPERFVDQKLNVTGTLSARLSYVHNMQKLYNIFESKRHTKLLNERDILPSDLKF